MVMRGNRNIVREIMLHVLFCLVVLLTTFQALYSYIGPSVIRNLSLSIISCVFFLLCIYAGRWLYQRWYLQNKYIHFLLYTVLCCIVILVFWWLFVKYLFFRPRLNFVEISVSVGPFFILALVIGIIIKLTRTSIKRQVREAQITAEQKQSELELLQSQLGPHFLFNTLNNIYGISIAQPERIPDLLIKLSDLLRYSVYETKKQFVPLQEELAYINNYIGFEKMRISDRLVLKTNIDKITNSNIQIAPLILIVFIENAFKHAKNTLEQKIIVEISLGVTKNLIVFQVKNSHKRIQHEKSEFYERSGFGLSNIIKRLSLLYGNDYDLSQQDDDDMYTVHLRLKIK
jgi:sensor histidine kinase YesM